MKNAYLAGIVDGEGTITLLKHTQHRNDNVVLRPRLIVSNTDVRLMDYLKENFLGSVTSSPPRKEGYKTSYVWRVCGQEPIAELLTGILPFLVTKKEQAVLLLNFLKSRSSQKSNAPYTERELQIQQEIAELNKR